MSVTKKYLLIMFLVICAPLAIVAIINISVDPYGVFGIERITGYNHFMSDSFYRSTGSELKKHRIKTHIQQTNGPILIIGSSKILWGTNTCEMQGVDRAGLYGLTFKESTEFLKTALESGNFDEIFVEILNTRNHIDSFNLLPSKLNPAMYIGLSTLKVAIANLHDSRKYSLLEKRNCFSYSTSTNPIEVAIRDDINAQIDNNRNFKNDELLPGDIRDSLTNIRSVCEATNLEKINIIYFFSPIHPNTPHIDRIQKLKHENRKVLGEFLPSTIGKCTIDFIDVDSIIKKHDTLKDSDWFDFAHFRPSLGNKVLHELIDYQKHNFN